VLTNTVCIEKVCVPVHNPVLQFTVIKHVFSDANHATNIDGHEVNLGTTVYYVVTVTNTGLTDGVPPAALTDTITGLSPSQYTILTPPAVSQGAVSPNSTTGPWSWTVGTIPAGQHATFDLTVTPNATGVLTNTACIQTDCSPVHITVVQPALTLQKCIGTTNTPCVTSSTAAVGDTVSYLVVVTNTGQTTANNVLIDDKLGGDAGFTVNDGTNSTSNSFSFTGVQPSGAVTKLGTGHYQWTYSSLQPGQSGTVVFTTVIQTPGSIASIINNTIHLTNTAAATSSNTPSPPEATVVTTAPLPASGVQAIHTPTGTTTPTTGAQLNIRLGLTLMVSGLVLLTLGALWHRRRPLDAAVQ
jgi:uncharacterized repeat protein (TIGR01451 family)